MNRISEDGRKRILITGTVQGVGFRPLVYRTALKHCLSGFVMNTRSGLMIEVEGDGPSISAFQTDIASRPPTHAVIASVEELKVALQGSSEFAIVKSDDDGDTDLTVAPDTAACQDCIDEIFDPRDRRFRYPFNSCINCGPRHSIAQAPPFDRMKTSMKTFEMCSACKREYKEPTSRRFHSQTNSCPQCGPRLWLANRGGSRIDCEDPLAKAVEFLQKGMIGAIKGIGGFHLAVNAEDEAAVGSLRKLKHRPAKPFAIMSAGIEDIASYAEITSAEQAALCSPAAPVVLLRKRQGSHIADSVAPGLTEVGVMPAYAPLHHLLLRDNFVALVMTSGNRSGEPLICTNEEAVSQLAGVADFFLLHNRDIVNRCDDSILRFAGTTRVFLRRGRGLVPQPILLDRPLKQVCAYGAHQKNTVCITKGKRAFVSRYIGDLDNLKSIEGVEETVQKLESLLVVTPEVIACDLHPDYASSKLAEEHGASERRGAPLRRVQHHHAHAVSCMAENHLLEEKVIGVIFDGAGLGHDGALWGSEFLEVEASNCLRLAHMKYVSMPGGEAAVREPYRMAISYMYQLYGEQATDAAAQLFSHISPEKTELLLKIIRKGEYAPLTSGMGRLYDAVAALLGFCTVATFEGEGALRLESVAATGISDGYSFSYDDGDIILIDPIPVVAGVLEDIRAHISKDIIAARFHNAIAGMTADVCRQIRERNGLHRIVLSGGVFQNRYLLDRLLPELASAGFEVFVHKQLPPNDECISLGQAVVASEWGS